MKTAAVILLLLAGCSESDPSVSGGVAGIEPDHETRDAVRRWLTENTDSGKWEEVRWWDAADARAAKFANCKAWAKSLRRLDGSDDAAWLKKCDAIKKEPAETAIRLKFRTATPVGGKRLTDKVFMVRDGRVVEHDDFAEEYGYRQALFPD